MNRQSTSKTHQQKQTATPAASGLLQRKCTCGNHTLAGGECEECGKRKQFGLQAKLRVNEPGDTYEHEADRIADQVMAMTAPHSLSGALTCIQRYSGQSNGQVDVAPDSVNQALASLGRPLEPALRQDMEQRFCHDFSRVQVHSGSAIEQSTQDVNAHAYTVGQDIVFACGQYAPHTADGRKLIAHELVHVVQQNTSCSAPEIVQCSPDNKPADSGTGVPENLLLWSTAVWPKRLDHDKKILMLAANPDHAHSSWKGLTLQEQIGVAVNMARFYGAVFAKQFVDIHKARQVPETVFRQVEASTPPSQLTARGFRLAGTQAQMNVEIWFHPSGSRLHRLIRPEPAQKPLKPVPEAEPEVEPEEGPEEIESAPIEEADLTEGQRKALALLQRMEHMNEEFRRMLDAEPPKTGEFMDKEPQFRTLREKFHQLVLEDDSVSEPDFSIFLVDRKAAVEAFIQLRNRAYGTDLGDWEQIERRTR